MRCETHFLFALLETVPMASAVAYSWQNWQMCLLTSTSSTPILIHDNWGALQLEARSFPSRVSATSLPQPACSMPFVRNFSDPPACVLLACSLLAPPRLLERFQETSDM